MSSIIDEAKTKLNNLHSLVLGSIQVAENDFSHLYTEIAVYGDNINNLGKLDIDDSYQTVNIQINQIKELANAANVDISSCLRGQEEVIKHFRDEFEKRLETCTSNKIQEAAASLKDSKYIVDVTMSSVHRLDVDLDNCGASITCISPIVTKIELDMIQLPQHIKTEVNKAEDLLKDLKVMVAECRDNNVAEFTSYVTSLVAIIENCVNKLIPKI